MAKTSPSPTYPMFPEDAALVVPGDTSASNFAPSIVFVGVAGNVRVLTAQGTDVVFTGLQGGSTLPCRVVRVFATNTTASAMTRVF